MYAIVDIAGQQFKVRQGQQLFVHRLKAEEGSQVSFDKVFLIGKDETIKVGTPVVEGAKVEAKVVEHLKGKKVIVFKKKRRKGFQKSNGHRQYLSKLVIENIIE
ncbi:MAG: 50S ribosomal protein L21 [Bacteroidales bacterium]|jgi:large subunit ribosomal protein L21|nr:50S ribosomal protein L21 [Bacteroidales bacterium]MCK9449548.1 50S ribosomal protein L21 [Bacteroidales bacterium]MDD3700720.1 50S ribosomal protein L21 [Bacteroidales bacterium]MDY0369388.1 50S ribosomal protein L21 [Bacteroidales bacterium]